MLGRLTHWVRTVPNVGPAAFLIGIGIMFWAYLTDYHLPYMPKSYSNFLELPRGWSPLPEGAYAVQYILAYLRLFILIGGGIYHIYIIRAFPDVSKMIRPTWVACGYIAFWVLVSQIYGQWEARRLATTGEVFSMTAFIANLLLILSLVISPPLAMRYYIRCKIMEKYLLRSFLQPLFFCFLAFFTLWVVMDLLDNMQDYQSNNISRLQVMLFYVKLIPFIFVTVAPITLLLSTLYTLGRMSRSNELISMLGTGKSMLEVLRPIYLVGLYAAFLGMAANYEWAPMAAGNKEKLLEDVKERMGGRGLLMQGLVYRNQESKRTWFVGLVPHDMKNDRLRRIEVRQEDENGRLSRAWFARSAYWWPDARVWSLYGGVEAIYKNGRVISLQNFNFDGTGFNRRDLEGLEETPWVLMSGLLTPDFLGVPELVSYIRANETYGQQKLAPYWTHLFYRFSLPWQSLVVVLFAAPLAVVFSRRGLVGGMTSAVLFFFAMLFLDNMFLNLGKSQMLPPFIAVWIPHLLLGSVGVLLFWMRAQNKELPKLSPKGLRELGSLFKQRRTPAKSAV